MAAHETESRSSGVADASAYRNRHAIVGVGSDLVDAKAAARTGYAGPIGPDYNILTWEDGEWK